MILIALYVSVHLLPSLSSLPCLSAVPLFVLYVKDTFCL